MTEAQQIAAAINNARWCDLIAQSHGVPGEFHHGCWINEQRMPPFYPNMVTFGAAQAANDIMDCLERLKQNPPSDAWAVKDSFMELELTEQGYNVLFEASWIWRDAHVEEGPSAADAIDWLTVEDADQLREWEWGWMQTDSAEGDYQGIFKSSLLDSPDVVIVGGWARGHFVAGGIGFVTGDVVGVSNLFTPQDDPLHCWQRVTYLIRERFPGKSMVGYEAGDSLVLARGDGFAPIGSLRIWVYAG
ncbi:hypothetical protein GC175_14150 [bacterium]|nr:hypothetical protein [bacterium]